MNIDSQTLRDLELISDSRNKKTIFNELDFTKTFGGSVKLKEYLLAPSRDYKTINNRQAIVQYIVSDLDTWCRPSMNGHFIEKIDVYLNLNIVPAKRKSKVGIFIESLTYTNEDLKLITESVNNVILFIDDLYKLYSSCKDTSIPKILTKELNPLEIFFNKREIHKLVSTKRKENALDLDFLYYDKLFREKLIDELKEVLNTFYLIETYYSLAKAVQQFNLIFPKFSQQDNFLKAEGLYHLFVPNPVKNDIQFKPDVNMLFLTGAKMAGKTTFMKACGVAVYLAHLGMGVPAKSMTLPVFDTIFSSINTLDNIKLGYSYYYSEVKRVKELAIKLKNREKVFVLFDELFKGTNLKDAYDASLLIIQGLSSWKESIFIISSHLTEIEKDIKPLTSIIYRNFESKIEDNKPDYTYKLKEGISHERLGLLILENEEVVSLLKK